jgi:kinetochore protein Fta7
MSMYAKPPNCGTKSILILLQRLLEANLATMNDSVDLLKAEIAKEEALLASETKSLQEMDKNAKRAEAERKRQTKKVSDGLASMELVDANICLQEHPVLRQLDELPQTEVSGSSEFTLLGTKESQTTLNEVSALGPLLACSIL